MRPVSEPRALGDGALGGSVGLVSLSAHKTTPEKKDATMLKRTDATPIPDTPETHASRQLKTLPGGAK